VKWNTRRLGDVLTLKRGHDLADNLRRDGDIPVVSSSGITGFHSEAKAKAPGVVTGRYGTLGEVYYLDQDYWPLNTALYVIDFKGTHPRFAAYFLEHILSGYQSDKAAVPGVNRNVLHELQVRVPERPGQERIAATLSAYDDLIENNRRRMKLLEDAARLLYQEWFVRLRFPGHERVRVKDGVPEVWRKETAFDAMQVMSGGTPKTTTPDFWAGDIPFYTPKDSAEGVYVIDTEKHLTEAGLNNCNSKLYPKDTVFITARGTVGNLNLAQRPMAMNQSCYALAGRGGVTQKYLFCALREAIVHFEQQASGGRVRCDNRGYLQAHTIRHPRSENRRTLRGSHRADIRAGREPAASEPPAPRRARPAAAETDERSVK
jgi:type I restriction enzyme S subunit